MVLRIVTIRTDLKFEIVLPAKNTSFIGYKLFYSPWFSWTTPCYKIWSIPVYKFSYHRRKLSAC